MKQRRQALFVGLAVWAVIVIALFASHRSGWGVFAVVLPFGLLIGAAKTMTDKANRISTVGVQGGGGLQCPKCGGSQFKAKRSAGGKMTLGVLAPKTRVKCVTCGTQYTRG